MSKLKALVWVSVQDIVPATKQKYHMQLRPKVVKPLDGGRPRGVQEAAKSPFGTSNRPPVSARSPRSGAPSTPRLQPSTGGSRGQPTAGRDKAPGKLQIRKAARVGLPPLAPQAGQQTRVRSTHRPATTPRQASRQGGAVPTSPVVNPGPVRSSFSAFRVHARRSSGCWLEMYLVLNELAPGLGGPLGGGWTFTLMGTERGAGSKGGRQAE